MSSRFPKTIRKDLIEGQLPRPRRRAGLGPVGNSMIELIGASFLAHDGPQSTQPQAAIWAKI